MVESAASSAFQEYTIAIYKCPLKYKGRDILFHYAVHLESNSGTEIYEFGRYNTEGNLRKRSSGKYSYESLVTAWKMKAGATSKSKVI